MAEPAARRIDGPLAQLAERRYLDGVEGRLRALPERIPNPATGRQVRVRRWAATERDDEGLEVQAFLHRTRGAHRALPRNGAIRFLYRPSWVRAAFGGKPLVVEACVVSHWRTLATHGTDDQPAGTDDLNTALGRATGSRDARGGHVLAVASPTGWSEEAIEHMSPAESGRTAARGRIATILVDLAAGRVIADRTDPLARLWARLFDPTSAGARDADIRTGVRELLLLSEDELVTVEAAVRLTRADIEAVTAAMRGMEAEGEGKYEPAARAFRRVRRAA